MRITPTGRRGRRLAGAAIAAASLVALAASSTAHAVLDNDNVKVNGPRADFGGSVWGVHSPVGSGNMSWDVVDGFYTPRLTGTLHVEDADNLFARMHISYWDGGGNMIATRHGGIVHVDGDDHDGFSVDLSPINLSQIVEAHVCTELSVDGVHFWQEECADQAYLLGD
jgi:hypothetical protein